MPEPSPHDVSENTDASPLPMLSPDEARAAAAALGLPDALAAVHLLRFTLRAPKVAEVVRAMVDMAVLGGTLDARTREVAILRVGWRIGSVYEWSNHVPIARRAGLRDDEIAAVRPPGAATEPGPLRDTDRVAIAVVDEVLDATVVSPETLAEARRLFGDGSELVELVAIPGCYRAIGSLLLSFSVPLEPHVEAWPPDGRASTPRPRRP